MLALNDPVMLKHKIPQKPKLKIFLIAATQK